MQHCSILSGFGLRAPGFRPRQGFGLIGYRLDTKTRKHENTNGHVGVLFRAFVDSIHLRVFVSF